MEVHTGGRGTGKTHELVHQLAREEGGVLLVLPPALDFARTLGMQKFRMTRSDVIRRIQPHGCNPDLLRGQPFVLIDNAEALLRRMLHAQGTVAEIAAVSIEGTVAPRQYEQMQLAVSALSGEFERTDADR